MAFLRDFRSKVAILKKQGLVSSKVDARSAYPKWKSDGKSLKSLVTKYDDIVSGKVTAVEVEPAALRKYRALGYETSKGKVLVPHDEGEIARKISGERIIIKNVSGIERIRVPVEYHDVEQYLSEIERKSKLIDKMKAKNESFGFRVRSPGYTGSGGYSVSYYRNIDLAIEDLRKYEIVSEGEDLYAGLEIFRISKPSEWSKRVEHQMKERTKRSGAKRNKIASAKYRRRNRSKLRTKDAERKREMRAKLKGKKLEEYKRKARKRARKSRK